MSKRRLSHQQKKTIHDRLQERFIATDNAGLVIAHHGRTAEVEMQNGQLVHCQLRQNMGDLVAGDVVSVDLSSEALGVITAIKPRESVLGRTDKKGQIKPVAANVNQIFIVLAPKPEIIFSLLDSYLVAAELLKITPSLLINKIDILSPIEVREVLEHLSVYSSLGYSIIQTSAKTQEGLDSLHKALMHKTSVFIGQSGVGKSSLLSNLIPEQEIRIGALNLHSGKGRHTTTTARLYHLPIGGDVIDSPGIREFGLGPIRLDQLCRGFREFQPFLSQCKYRNCEHRDEDRCGLQTALREGKITQQRWHSFQKLIQPKPTFR